MKSGMAIAAVGLAALGLANSANAFKFSPATTRFAAKGPVSATLNGITLSGNGTFKGDVNKRGKGKITAVRFCGAQGCGIVNGGGLPWAMTASGAAKATIANVTFTSSAGDCGPANLHVAVSGGVISYNGPFAQCSQVTLTLTTTPAISIVP